MSHSSATYGKTVLVFRFSSWHIHDEEHDTPGKKMQTHVQFNRKRSQLPFFFSRLLSILGYCTNMAVPDKGLVGEHLKGSFSKGDEKKVILNFRRLKTNENIITNVIVHFCQ